MNSQNTAVSSTTATVNFGAGNGIAFNVVDAKDPGVTIADYRWIIEEDTTIGIDPNVETSNPTTPPKNLAVNFHSSALKVVAQGCTGESSCESGQSVLGAASVCDVGNGGCRPGAHKDIVTPDQVTLDPNKRYYISILPGDAADPGHGMGGSQIGAGQRTVNVTVQPLPYPTAKISVFVFEDDNPLNGENDTGGGVDILAPNEPGLEGFNIVLLDQTGQFGDPAGQLTYDEFGQPVSNSLAGTIDPVTGLNACPISKTSTDGLVGMIVTCPKYEDGVDQSGNKVLSPWQATPSSPTCTRACTRSIPPREPIAPRAAKSGCRRTRWTAPRTSRLLSSPTSPVTSRNSDRGLSRRRRLRQSEDHQRSQGGPVCGSHRGLHRHHQRPGHEHAHEPHPGSARLQQWQLRHLQLRDSAT